MILEYFGERTNSLTVRRDCCDNCANGLSSWRLKDLFYGISRTGSYNFEKDARLLLRAMEELEEKKKPLGRERIVNHMLGNGYGSELQTYGSGRLREPYYWNAFIDQLIFHDYITLVPGNAQLTLAVKARKWLTMRDRLWLEPVGAIYRFLRPKPGTPLSGTKWSRSYRNGVEYNEWVEHSVIHLMFGP